MAEAAFGVQLRQSRQAAALSLRQLATRVGYDHSYLSQVERGQRPGSAHLARLCDRELNTGTTLTTAYQQANPQPEQAQTAVRSRPTEPTGPTGPTHSGQPAHRTALPATLEAIRHGLAESFKQSHATNEWHAVAADLAMAFSTTPPGELLPELAAQLQLLPAESPEHAVPATELSALVALTLTGLGQTRAARRWWSTCRASAESSGDRLAMSLVRAWEAAAGLAERRPLGNLLTLADEAVTLAIDSPSSGAVLGGRAGCLARAHADRALVLAQQGLAAISWDAAEELLAVTAELPVEETSGLFDWPAYKVHGIEGQVCAELGYPAAGYVVLERALEMCPLESRVGRAELELCLARCLMVDGEVAAGLALAMRALVELPDEWHTQYLYDAGARVLSAVPGKDLVRPAVRDYRELLGRRPYLNRTVGSGSSYAGAPG